MSRVEALVYLKNESSKVVNSIQELLAIPNPTTGTTASVKGYYGAVWGGGVSSSMITPNLP